MEASVRIEQGELPTDRTLPLTANWDVYWGKLLSPDSIDQHSPDVQAPFVSVVPEDVTANFKQDRFATYRLHISLTPGAGALQILMPEIRAASHLWVNGDLVMAHGRPAQQAPEQITFMRPTTIDLSADQTEYELIIQVSSYGYHYMGPLTPLLYAPRSTMQASITQARMRDLFVLSAILIMAFYHLAIFLRRRDRREALYFAGFCIGVLGITIVRGGGQLIFYLHPEVATQFYYRLDFFSLSVAMISISYFVRLLYPRQIWWIVGKTNVILSILFMGCAIMAPGWIIERFLPVMQLGILIGGLFYLYNVIQAVRAGEPDARLFLLGFVLIFFGAINDILRTNNLALVPAISHLTLFAFIFIQSVILSNRFSRAFDQLEIAEGHIRQLNMGLEQKVEQRTRTIRMILDHVQTGFLLIDRDLNVAEGFTRSCCFILGPEVKQGVSFLELFDVTENEQARLELSLQQVFDDLMPAEASLRQIPSRLRKDERQIRIQASDIRNQTGSIEHLLITLTDATELAAMERRVRHNESLLKIMQSMLNFKVLIRETLEQMSQAKVSLAGQDQDQIRLLLHTIKGNLASYGLEDIATLIHQIEDQRQISQENLDGIVGAITGFLANHHDLLHIDVDRLSERHYQIGSNQLYQLHDALQQQAVSADALITVQHWIEDVQKVTIRDLLGPIEKMVQRFANSLGKIIRLDCQGDEILVDAERLQTLIYSLVHLVRNSIDHGIEVPEARGEKSQEATIFMSFWLAGTSLCIDVGDDGRGIDSSLIKQKAVEVGLFEESEIEHLDRQQVLALIFRHGFSTAEDISEISGRGLGLAAVREAVTELDGTIEVVSTAGKGTSFHLRIPIEAETFADPDVRLVQG